jgi:hypothetical protein
MIRRSQQGCGTQVEHQWENLKRLRFISQRTLTFMHIWGHNGEKRFLSQPFSIHSSNQPNFSSHITASTTAGIRKQKGDF